MPDPIGAGCPQGGRDVGWARLHGRDVARGKAHRNNGGLRVGPEAFELVLRRIEGD